MQAQIDRLKWEVRALEADAKNDNNDVEMIEEVEGPKTRSRKRKRAPRRWDDERRAREAAEAAAKRGAGEE